MLVKERQQKIAEILTNRNSVTITELERLFGVSGETVRRDLLALESSKQLIRTHGGALSISNNMKEKSFEIRHTENLAEKQEIAECAVGFINEGDIISIDSGSTSVVFCNVLKENFENLTIVTNSLMLLNILSRKESFKIILCSGEYDHNTEAFYGMLTLGAIKQLHTSKAFICPSAISLKLGLTEFNENTIPLQQTFVDIADKCFVLADSTKFESAGLYNSIHLNSDITVITDHKLSSEVYEKYINADIDIIRGE